MIPGKEFEVTLESSDARIVADVDADFSLSTEDKAGKLSLYAMGV